MLDSANTAHCFNFCLPHLNILHNTIYIIVCYLYNRKGGEVRSMASRGGGLGGRGRGQPDNLGQGRGYRPPGGRGRGRTDRIFNGHDNRNNPESFSNGYNTSNHQQQEEEQPPLANFFNFASKPLPVIPQPPCRWTTTTPSSAASTLVDDSNWNATKLPEFTNDDNKNYVERYQQEAEASVRGPAF